MSLWLACLLAVLCATTAVEAQLAAGDPSVLRRDQFAAAGAAQSGAASSGSFTGNPQGAARGTANTFSTTTSLQPAGTNPGGSSRTSSASTLTSTFGGTSSANANNNAYNNGGTNSNINGNQNSLAANGLNNGKRNTGNQNDPNADVNHNKNSDNKDKDGNGDDKDKKKCGNEGCGGGRNDPIMTGFSGRSFNFFGDIGKTYNLISSMNHQMSMKLKPVQTWNHNGTNMMGIGFMYKSYKVLMELDGDTPRVYVNEKQLPEKKKVQRHAWRFEDGTDAEMSWNMYMPGVGNTVVVQTDVLKAMLWHTPKGIIDEGGMVLEGYLNFNISLLAPPENGQMNGIIGETYERFTVGQEAFNPNSTYWLPEDNAWHGKGPEQDYEMANYWDTKFKMNLFGLNSPAVRERQALEVEDDTPMLEQLSFRRKLLFTSR